MKKSILYLAALIVLSMSAISQQTYNVVIFSEDGEPFYAFVNGIRQNEKPETNIKVTGLTSEALNVRVEFENKALPKLKQNMMPEPGYEHTINIRKNMKKEMKMAYFGKVALDQAPKGSSKEIAYHTAESTTSDNVSGTNAPDFSSTGGNGGYNTGNGGVSVTSTTTSTQISTNPNSININMGGTGINVNMNGMGQTQTTTGSTVSSTTSGYTTTSSTGGSVKNPNPGAGATTQPVNTKSGCSVAMSEANFQKMKKSVEDKPFSETKMSTAKIATKNSCMSSAQIKGICELFNMDDDRLAYAQYAYDYCVDKANYYTVSEIFSFSTTTDKFNKFLEAK